MKRSEMKQEQRPMTQVMPGLEEAEAIRTNYRDAMAGLEAFVEMGMRMIDVKNRCAHGEYMPWCRRYLAGLSMRHVQRAKAIAEGLLRVVGMTLPVGGEVAVMVGLPEAVREIVRGAADEGGIRALMCTIQDASEAENEAKARKTVEAIWEKDALARDEFEPKVLSGALTWCRCLQAMSGQHATAGVAKPRHDYGLLLPKSLITLRNGFKHWEDLEAEARAVAIADLKATLREAPDVVREALMRELMANQGATVGME